MENEELVKALQDLASDIDKPVFSEEEYAVFNKYMTPEQVKELENAENRYAVLDVLPDDEAGIQRLGAALGAISGANPKENMDNLKLIAEKDPERFVQLMALTSVAENEAEANE